jgi:hypothetical protein
MAQHAAAERNTQRPFQETLLGMSGTIPAREDTNRGGRQRQKKPCPIEQGLSLKASL